MMGREPAFRAAGSRRFSTALTVLALAGALALSACLAQPHPDKHHYRLSVPAGEVQAQAKNRRTILAGPASAASTYDTRALVYRLGPDRYERDFYNEFTAPPTRLLVDLAVEHLDRTSRKARVVKIPGQTLADFGLETYLESLYGDFTVNPPQAVVAVRYTLNDLRGDRPRVLLDKTYQRRGPVSSDRAPDLVAAFNRELADLLDELNRDIDKALP